MAQDAIHKDSVLQNKKKKQRNVTVLFDSDENTIEPLHQVQPLKRLNEKLLCAEY